MNTQSVSKGPLDHIEFLDDLAWSEPKEVQLKKRIGKVKSLAIDDYMWDFWKLNKIAMQDAGFSISKFGGSWTLNWWDKKDKGWIFPAKVEWPAPKIEGETIVEQKSEPPREAMLLRDWKPLVNESGLKPWQPPLVGSVVAAMEEFNASLDAAGTGVGKTFITLGAARERGKRLLVICPKNLTIKWKRAGHAMGVEVYAFGWEWIKTGKTMFGHWEMIPPKKAGGKSKRGDFIWTVPKDFDIAFDEIHRASGIDTQNSHIVMRAKVQGLPIHGLSATVADTPVKMKAVGYVLGLHDGGRGYYDWMARHGVVEKIIMVGGGRRIKTYKFEGKASDLQKIHATIFPTKGVRVTPESLGDVFPPNTTSAEPYNMEEEKEIQAAYEEMKARVAEIEFQRNMTASEKANSILTEILRARQKVELLKVPLLISLTRDSLEEGNSVFVAVNFKETISEFIKGIPEAGVLAGLSTGSKILGRRYNEHDRQNAIDDFQSNKTRVIIGITAACREGLDLQDEHGGHPRESFILPGQSAFWLKQVLGRIWRSTGVTPSFQHIVFAANTIEEDVCINLATKLDQLDLLMDGDLQGAIFPAGYSTMREDEEAA